MTDPDLKLAREIAARFYSMTANEKWRAGTMLNGSSDGDFFIQATLAAIKAGRAAEKAERKVPDDLREMALDLCRWPFVTKEAAVEAIFSALTKARAAGVAQERERCAAIPKKLWRELSPEHDCDHIGGYSDACDEIEAAIKGGENG